MILDWFVEWWVEILGVIFAALVITFAIIAVWTGSQQWGGTAIILLLPAVILGITSAVRADR